MKILLLLLVVVLLGVAAIVFYLFRPLSHKPVPAQFDCLEVTGGLFVSLDTKPTHIYGIGLSYAGHINETASEFDPNAAPPVFEKDPRALTHDGSQVQMPSSEELISAAAALEPGLGDQLREKHPTLPALLDYETELGFLLLEDIDPAELEDDYFIPKLAFFIANDLSARSVAVLGEGQPNRHEYWGVSKSFPGFLPIATRAWVPETHQPRGIPCVDIETRVNGDLRQRQNTSNLIYTPIEMLRHIQAKYPNRQLRRGDLVLTGTPGGVAMHTPRWLMRLANLIGLDRFKKLTTAVERTGFLQPGDEVVVAGEGLGSVRVTITE